MVGPGIKKYAKEKGFKIANGVAYSVVDGYMVTLADGFEMKKLGVSCAVTDDVANKLAEIFSDKKLKNQYRILECKISKEGVLVIFNDSTPVLKKVKEFISVLLGILKENNVLGDGFCTACGNNIEIGDSCNVVLVNGIAHRVHSGCAKSVSEIADVDNARHEVEEKHIGKGVVGALIGSVFGGIVWAIAYYMGWFFSVIGALIGFLASKGYEKFGGKNCKAKIAVVLIATLFGAFFGQVIGDCALIATEIQGTEYVFADIPFLYLYLLGDGEFFRTTIGNFLLGSLFAFAGTIGVLRKTISEADDATIKSNILE